MKQPAANNSSRENRAAAHTPQQRRSAAAALPAPAGVIQAVLDPGQTYKAKQAVTAYDATNKLNQVNIANATLVTAIKHDVPSTLTEVYDRTDAATKFTPTIPDDTPNFGAVGPKLANDHIARITTHPEHFEYSDYSNNALGPLDPLEISQGEMGDCWLIAAMAAMTTSPHWRAFLLHTVASNGGTGFDVRLFDRMSPGQVQIIVSISGMLLQLDPSSTYDRQLVYAQQRSFDPNDPVTGAVATDPVWPALIEKAAAEVFGSYELLDNLEVTDGYKLLTGNAGTVHTPRTANLSLNAWKILKDQKANGAAMTATTAENIHMPMGQKMAASPATLEMQNADIKLLENHAYIVIGFNSKGMQLLNPHGDPHPVTQTRPNINQRFARVEVLPAP
jgi:hypothetical protein